VKHPQDEFAEEAELSVDQELEQELEQESSPGSFAVASGTEDSFSAEEREVPDDEVDSSARDSFINEADTAVVAVVEDSAGTESTVSDDVEPAEADEAELTASEEDVAEEDAAEPESADLDSAGLEEAGLEEADPADADPADADPADADPAPVVTETSGSSFDDTPLARELSEITRRRRALAAEELPLPSKTRVFTVANQKGGVGKTTTTVNLAAALARNGARVLVIDLDPQGNSSTALGIEHRSETVSVYDVIINDVEMDEVVQKSPEFDALYCIPATIHLAGAEIELVSLVAREQRLRTALDRFLEESEEPFHYVFIDCPPSLGLLTINAFVAASEVLIPIQCEYYALEGLSQLLTNIQLIERHLNPHLSVSTILLTMYDGRTNLANQVAQDVRDHFPDQVLDTLIPRSVRISEAPSYGQSVISYDSSSPGSLSYLEAAAEIARRGAPN
jgi:chromosome partitioning protein